MGFEEAVAVRVARVVRGMDNRLTEWNNDSERNFTEVVGLCHRYHMIKGEGGLFQKGTGTMSLNASDHIQNHAYVDYRAN